MRTIDENGCLKCSACREKKPVSDFSRDRSNPTGYRNDCNDCHRAVVKRTYERNRDKILAQKATYRNENRQKRREQDRQYYLRHKSELGGRYTPEIGKAGKAVQSAVKRGTLPKVATMYCVRCFQPAKNYHHQSYLESDRLCVVPVCRTCHHKMNRQRLEITEPLGVVTTRYGMVRIAIAYPK